MKVRDFLKYVSKSLKTANFRYTAGKSRIIKTVAVCGGSGADLLNSAIKKGADAFITADIKYHPFQDAENRILFIDAGHYETEIHVLNIVKSKLEKFIKSSGRSVRVFKFTGSSNPVKFFNNKGVK
jgi:putative NIF3 family GTP cyclohydrolase 1 type 2